MNKPPPEKEKPISSIAVLKTGEMDTGSLENPVTCSNLTPRRRRVKNLRPLAWHRAIPLIARKAAPHARDIAREVLPDGIEAGFTWRAWTLGGIGPRLPRITPPIEVQLVGPCAGHFVNRSRPEIRGADVVALVALAKGITHQEAARWICARYLGNRYTLPRKARP